MVRFICKDCKKVVDQTEEDYRTNPTHVGHQVQWIMKPKSERLSDPMF